MSKTEPILKPEVEPVFVLDDPELGVLSRDVPTREEAKRAEQARPVPARRETCAETVAKEWMAAMAFLGKAPGGPEHMTAVGTAFRIAHEVLTSPHPRCPWCPKNPNAGAKKGAE